MNDAALRLAPQTPPEAFWVRASYDGVPLLLGQVGRLRRGTKKDEADRPIAVVPSTERGDPAPAAGIIPLTEKFFR